MFIASRRDGRAKIHKNDENNYDSIKVTSPGAPILNYDGTKHEISIDFSAKNKTQGLLILGDEHNEKITDPHFGDIILGHAGMDILTGNARNGLLLGGTDYDVFVFYSLSCHDLIIESDANHHQDNLIQLLEHSKTGLERAQKDDDLIIMSDSVTDWSITTTNHFRLNNDISN